MTCGTRGWTLLLVSRVTDLGAAWVLAHATEEPYADSLPERTKSRPIAAGEVSHKAALAFLSTQMALGLAILTQLNWYSIVLGAASLPLVAIYPFMKRVTYYPQVVLGELSSW